MYKYDKGISYSTSIVETRSSVAVPSLSLASFCMSSSVPPFSDPPGLEKPVGRACRWDDHVRICVMRFFIVFFSIDSVDERENMLVSFRFVSFRFVSLGLMPGARS